VGHGIAVPTHSMSVLYHRRHSMSTTIYHKHHIVPRHAGGTDDPSNLVLLSVEDHALAHKELWEKYGRWQDKVAWICLSNQVTSSEAIRLIISEANLGHTRNVGENNPMFGKTHTEEARKRIGEASKKRQTGKSKGPMSEERKKKISESLRGKKKSPEHVKKLSENRLGENNPNYRHGKRSKS
jgi:hypothetical protein